MTISRLAYLITFCTVGLGQSQVAAQSTCRAADDVSARLVQWVKNVATGTDTWAADVRAHTKIPFVIASQVTYVTTQSVCNKALNPYNAETAMQNASTGTPIAPSGRLYVVKVGGVYVVWDPAKTAGEYGTYVTLDSKYRVLWSGIG